MDAKGSNELLLTFESLLVGRRGVESPADFEILHVGRATDSGKKEKKGSGTDDGNLLPFHINHHHGILLTTSYTRDTGTLGTSSYRRRTFHLWIRLWLFLSAARSIP